MSRGERTRMFRGKRTRMMFRVVFVVVFARSDEPEFFGRLIRAQVADFACRMARDGQKEKRAAARAFHFDSKALVRLVVQQRIWFGGAQNMPIQSMRALRRFVFDGVEQSAIIRGPRNAGDAFESLGKRRPRVQVFDLQHVLAETRGIRRIGEQLIVVADLERTQSQKRMAFHEPIQVQQQFLRRVFRVTSPAVERILLPLFRAREIEIASQPVGNGKIRLLDAHQHFLIELLLQRFRGLQNSVGIRVFGLQIVDDFRIFFVAQPGVMIYAAIAMQNVLHRFTAGSRWLGNRTS